MKTNTYKAASLTMGILAALFFLLSIGAAPDYGSSVIDEKLTEMKEISERSEFGNFEEGIGDLEAALKASQAAERKSNLLLSIAGGLLILALVFRLLTTSLKINNGLTSRVTQ